MRAGPGHDFDQLIAVAAGEPLMVLQGPTTNDSTIWYEVRGVSLKGWIAGNLLRRLFVETTDEATETRLVGDRSPAHA